MGRLWPWARPGHDAAPQESDAKPLGAFARALCIAFIMVIALAFGAAIRTNVEQGQHRAMWSFGNFVYASAALSTEWNYGVGKYVYYSSPQGISASVKTQEAGLTWDFDYMTNQPRIDAALERLFLAERVRLPDDTTGPPYNQLMGVGWGMDIGLVDFLALAFSLFGIKLLSVFLTLCLLLGLSAGAFVVAFRRDPLALGVLALFMIGYYAFVTSPGAMERSLYYTVTNPKFFSFLCIIPLLHAGFMILNGDRPRALNAVLLVAQLALLFFAIHNRTTATWAVLALVLMGAARLYGDRWMRRLTWSQSLRGAWVALAALAVVVVGNVLVISATHPAMAASGQEPRHTIWVSAYCSLTFHPDWEVKYAAAHDNRGCEDAARVAFKKYLERHPVEDNGSLYRASGGYRHDVMDRIVRAAYFELAANDPRYIAELFAIYVPQRLDLLIGALLSHMLPDVSNFTFAVATAVGLALLAFLLVDRGAGRRFLYVAAAAPVVFAASMSPNWLVLVMWDSLADSYLLFPLLVALAAIAAALGLAHAVAALVRLRGRIVAGR